MSTPPSKQVIFEELPAQHGRIGKVILNRPEALNALSPEMIIELDDRLRSWAKNKDISAVIMTSNSDKAFCAGGDIKHLYTVGPQAYIEDIPFFRYEYELDGFINKYPKPYISLLNNIAMGGGLGISVNGATVVAASNLRLAMPETGIGLYPDTGATYFLSRCPNNLGMYLGLTGRIIGVADAVYCGLVDYYIPEEKFPALINALCDAEVTDFTNVLQSFASSPKQSLLIENVEIIDKCFAKDSVIEIINALQAMNNEWSQQCAAHLNTRSPQSLIVTHKALNMAKDMSLDEALAMEFSLTLNVIQTHDFNEGVRAALVDKDRNPLWSPASLHDVTEEHINQLFDMRWKL